MKYLLPFILILFVAILLRPDFGVSKSESNLQSHPRPTNGIEIPENYEDGSTKNLKKEWFKAIHSSSSETNWRQVELQNTLNKLSLIQI